MDPARSTDPHRGRRRRWQALPATESSSVHRVRHLEAAHSRAESALARAEPTLQRDPRPPSGVTLVHPAARPPALPARPRLAVSFPFSPLLASRCLRCRAPSPGQERMGGAPGERRSMTGERLREPRGRRRRRREAGRSGGRATGGREVEREEQREGGRAAQEAGRRGRSAGGRAAGGEERQEGRQAEQEAGRRGRAAQEAGRRGRESGRESGEGGGRRKCHVAGAKQSFPLSGSLKLTEVVFWISV